MAHDPDSNDTPCRACAGRGSLRGLSRGGEPDECWDSQEPCDACCGGLETADTERPSDGAGVGA
jgi:hypothetical protein